VPNPLGSILNRVRTGLLVQAAATGALAAGPLASGSFAPDRWLPLVAGSAAGALVLAWFTGTRTRSAWIMTVGFELLALTVGGAGLADGRYFPGTALALVVLAQLLLPSGRLAFPSVARVAQAPVRLTPPPVVAAAPARPSAPPASPPLGLLVAASAPPPMPPPPSFPPPGTPFR
jgi:hypothetical protein